MKNINYLFDNQVTPLELDCIVLALEKQFEGILYNNLHNRIHEVVETALAMNIGEDQKIIVSYDLVANKGQIDSILGNIRNSALGKDKGKKK